MSHLFLSSLDNPTISHIEHMLSCWFEMSCREVMLTMCSQVHVYTTSLIHTLNHFVEDLSTTPPSISQTSTKLHSAVSTISDQVLLPKIAQRLRLPPRKSALHNPGIDLSDCHLEQHKSFPRSHLNLHYPQANTSRFPLVNWRV